ncbi:hypothetical protein OSB04_026304 [Centaurea solstitialis]|uniref:mannosyl-glycoprotein endo-beta-N-acetylglucosaminidase n=1 Tax=Centaurea solstitialis TaxID=347529 RepID=A0AA38SWQ9_9ASTR|nr:hypothetical protein OSB04_026304 [Centaurea solstitialis]
MNNNNPQIQSTDDFDPIVPSTPVSYPIKTLEDLKLRSYFDSFHFQFNKASVPLISGGGIDDDVLLPNRRRMMVCHDMEGGYTDDDRWIQGGRNPDAYAILALVFGGFPCNNRSAQLYAERLSELAVALGFDGWLINMEVELDIGRIPILKEFVSHLTKGKLDWQDQLNDKNKPFFDICDGIFMNYTWKEDYPRSSAAVAGNRQFDVYMGIDVFGRGTYGDGQWTTNVALDVLKKDDVSAAIFAPGWVYETKQPPDFQTAQNRWWSLVEKSWGIMRSYPKVLPFYSNFDRGNGYHLSVDGRLVSDASWNNLSNQSSQPCLEFFEDDANETIQAFVDFKQASYSGGGNITFKGVLGGHDYLTRRIFHEELCFGNSAVHFTYSVKSDGSSVIGLQLDFTNTTDPEIKISVLLASWGDTLLTMDRFSSKFSRVIMPHHVEKLETAPEWIVQDNIVTVDGFTLTAIHAVCYKSNPKVEPPKSPSNSSQYHAVLGHIAIKTTTENMVFPLASEWTLESRNVDWRSDPQGQITVSLKIIWALNGGVTSMFSKYNVYVENEADKSSQGSKYLGVASVEAFYVSELLVPAGVSSVKFVIQACGFDGSCSELAASPFIRLRVEEKTKLKTGKCRLKPNQTKPTHIWKLSPSSPPQSNGVIYPFIPQNEPKGSVKYIYNVVFNPLRGSCLGWWVTKVRVEDVKTIS